MTSSDHWKRVFPIFSEALAVPRGERAAVLARLCADDDELRAEVERVLESGSAGGDSLEPPTSFSLAEALGEGVFQGRVGQCMGGFELSRLVATAVGPVGMWRRAVEARAESKLPRRQLPIR